MANKINHAGLVGQFNAAVTNGNSETLVYTGAGALHRFSILTAGTASFSIYDGTQSTGGTLIFTSLTNDAVGTVKDCQFPVNTGIVVKGTTGSAGIGVFYSKSGVNGE